MQVVELIVNKRYLHLLARVVFVNKASITGEQNSLALWSTVSRLAHVCAFGSGFRLVDSTSLDGVAAVVGRRLTGFVGRVIMGFVVFGRVGGTILVVCKTATGILAPLYKAVNNT